MITNTTQIDELNAFCDAMEDCDLPLILIIPNVEELYIVAGEEKRKICLKKKLNIVDGILCDYQDLCDFAVLMTCSVVEELNTQLRIYGSDRTAMIPVRKFSPCALSAVVMLTEKCGVKPMSDRDRSVLMLYESFEKRLKSEYV